MNNVEERSYSQFGEDLALAEIFKANNGTCAEIGVLDGIKDSTTLLFEKRGWRCILIEANPYLAKEVAANRPNATVFDCAAGFPSADKPTVDFLIAHGAEYLSTMAGDQAAVDKLKSASSRVETVKVRLRSIDEIFGESAVQKIDFVTIDVEGAELQVLQGFDLERWKPKVLVLEDNSNGHDRRVRRFLYARKYRCFRNDGLNDWYARADDTSLVTPKAMQRDFRRQVRLRVYESTFGLLPLGIQGFFVKWKRKLLGSI